MEVIMQVPGSDNAGLRSDIFGPELKSEGKEALLEKKKADGIIFGSYIIFSDIFISECTLSLTEIISIVSKHFMPEICTRAALYIPDR